MAFLHGSWLLNSQRKVAHQGLRSTHDNSVAEAASAGEGGLFLWGEVWRGVPAQPLDPARAVLHPYSMGRDELLNFLNQLAVSGQLRLPTALVALVTATAKKSTRRQMRQTAPEVERFSTDSAMISWQSVQLALLAEVSGSEAGPTAAALILPYHSAASETPADPVLYPWSIEGLWLDAPSAIALLNSLPLNAVNQDTWIGGDLRFWSHVARWSLDLLARSKFLPTLTLTDSQSGWASWQPLLDSSTDQLRLLHFCKAMPSVCRMYDLLPEATEERSASAIALPTEPQQLLQSFLSTLLETQIRATASQSSWPGVEKGKTQKSGVAILPSLQEWLEALSQPTPTPVKQAGLESLVQALTIWTTPLQNQGFQQNLFRTCLYLHPPQIGETHWQLEYFLQAVDDTSLLVSASTIWNNPVEQLHYQGRIISHPQETFLMGLGLASRLCPPIEPSLQTARPQFCQLDPFQAYEFIKTTAWRLQDSGLGVVMPESLSSQGGWANRLGLKIQAQTGKLKKGQRLGLQSLLDFRWELSIGGQTLSKAEFDHLVSLNTPLVEINGEWVELRPADIRAAQQFFATRKEQPALSLEDALRISMGDTQMVEKLPVVGFEAAGNLQELINTLTGNRVLAPLPEPPGFRGELRPYQRRGVGWLAFLEQWGLGACLADDMGLGKTVQLLAFLLHLKVQKSLQAPVLLVCPTSVLGNWEREVKRFTPDLQFLIYHGDARPRGKQFSLAIQQKDLVITSYALVQRDLKEMQTVSWQGVVLDEAQNIKNAEAKQSQAIRQLETQFRIAMTGTPVENRLTELWSIMDFLNPGYLGPKNFFQRRFATPIERYGDTDSLKTLRSLVQPFILRRLKTDKAIIQDLPEKQEMAVFCGLTAEQAALYQQVVDQSLADIEAAEGIQRKGMILAVLVKLKQICNHPALFLKEANRGEPLAESIATDQTPISEEQAPAFHLRSGKLLRLQEMLEELVAEGDRALIFTQFAEWGKLLQAHLQAQLGREVLFLYGSTSRKNREEMINRFQRDPQGPPLFILSLKAGGVGLNLTRANHVFHFDRWWNPAVENQATDRVFRIGQTRNVQVHKFVSTGTLEEKIHDLIESKKALAEQVVGTGENWLTELDTNQLRDLLLLDRRAIIGEE